MSNTNQKGSGEPQNPHPYTDVKNNAGNFTAENAINDLLKFKYERNKAHQILIRGCQELINRNQELVMMNQELSDKILTEIEKRLGIK